MAAHEDRLDRIEAYYDEVPRRYARVEAVGPFTLFLPGRAGGSSYYARPERSPSRPVTVDDVLAAVGRQRDLAVPEAVEWIDELHPALAAVAHAAGLHVERCPLLVHDGVRRATVDAPDGVRVTRLTTADADLVTVVAAIGAGFEDTDTIGDGRLPTAEQVDRLASGGVRVFGAWDRRGPMGGGSHAPRGQVTELTGIAVIPCARRRGVGSELTTALVEDAVAGGAEVVFLSAADQTAAGLYRRLGFVEVATACIAGPPG